MNLACKDANLLLKAKGYWSEREIFFNPTERVILLDQAFTYEDAKSIIDKEVRSKLEGWLTSEFENVIRGAENPHLHSSGYNVTEITTSIAEGFGIKRRRQRKIRPRNLVRILRDFGHGDDQIVTFFMKEWLAYYAAEPFKGVNEYLHVGQELLFIPWSMINPTNVDAFLSDMFTLSFAEVHPGQFDPKFKKRPGRIKRKDYGDVLKEAIPKELWEKFQAYAPIDLKCLSGSYVYMVLCTISRAALSCLLMLRENRICVLPATTVGRANILDKRGTSRSVYGYDLIETFEIGTRAQLWHLYTSTTIESLSDIPENIRDVFSCYKGTFPSALAYLLKNYSNKNNLKEYPYENLRKTTKVISRKYSPQWCRINLPKPWFLFAKSYWSQNKAGELVKCTNIGRFISWAYDNRKYQSPYDVQTHDLRNPHLDTEEMSFYTYLKDAKMEETIKASAWSGAELIYRITTNDAKLPGSPLHGLPVHNPFTDLQNPFFYETKRGGFKTVRPRMQQSLIEAMIDTLLEPDEEGRPTFKWAESVTPNEKVTVTDPENPRETIKIWNPSRATCLATLLLTPIRGAQARWLDQGLMDKMIFDPDTGKMVQNAHPLGNWRYVNGKTHEEQYGRPSGILQLEKEALIGKECLVIFVNTNKTQMWNPYKKTGDTIPWPDGLEFIESGIPELISAGQWLNRVYQVIRFQLQWLKRYDPFPMPLSFHHIKEDIGRVDNKEEILAKMPWFVPVFRDLKLTRSYEYEGSKVNSHGPISKHKLTKLFHALAVETERRLRTRGIECNLTIPASASAICFDGLVCRYDIHSLRVAGISHLVEIGVPPHVVQYIVGHSALAMTQGYTKFQTPYIREKIIEGILKNGHINGFEDAVGKIQSGLLSREAVFINNSRCGDSQPTLPDDYAAFAPVEGGVCRMGGKGSRCNEGQLYTRTIEHGGTSGDVIEEYGPVQSGCGNCRFFTTGPLFINEQEFAGNLLMYRMRALGRQRRRLYDQLADLEIVISESKDLATTHNLEIQRLNLKQHIANMDETLAPMHCEWTNRCFLFMQSEHLLEDLPVSPDESAITSPDLITGPIGENLDYSPEMVETSEFGLVRKIVERFRFMEYKGVTLPEDISMALTQAMDVILDEEGLDQLLFKIRNKENRVKATSILANFYSWAAEGGDYEMQRVINEGGRLRIHEEKMEKLKQITSAIIGAARDGDTLSLDRFKQLSPDLLLQENNADQPSFL